MPIVFSNHAKAQLKRRGISEASVEETIRNPSIISTSFRGRKLCQSKIGGKILEVVTKTEGSKITIITAYNLEERL